MKFTWIKRYMPRSLFGRAVLILLVPIISLQLVVAGIFIQRHFDRVTRQLVRGVALEISAIVSNVEAAQGIDAQSRALSDTLRLPILLRDGELGDQPRRPFWDISGRAIISEMQGILARPITIDLVQNQRRVIVDVDLGDRVLSIDVPRGRMSASNPHQLIVLMVAASVILTLISTQFLRLQVRPIKRLARAAEAFGKGQSDPFRPSGAEEVRRAGTAFLAMRGRIERQLEQRTQMLSGVSHDLRTPLTRMRLALATAESAEDFEALENDITEMERMLEGFLNFARGDSQEESQIVDAEELSAQIVHDCQRMGLNIDYTVTRDVEDKPMISLKEMAVTRAVQNLVNNAARYGEQVALSLRIGARSISFSIEDDGPGISPSDREEAMRPFARLDMARNQDRGAGVGLGLAIALDVARSHGGSLQLSQSDRLGGLCASITLPR